MPNIVALGSRSAIKIEAAECAFNHFVCGGFHIVPVEVESSVRRQPQGLKEMFEGASNRARAATRQAPGAMLGLGLESGLLGGKEILDHPGYGFDVTAAVIYQPEGQNHFLGLGSGFPVPFWAVSEALRDSELGEVVMRRGAKEKNPMGYFSEGEVERRELIEQAIRMALVPLRHKGKYRQH